MIFFFYKCNIFPAASDHFFSADSCTLISIVQPHLAVNPKAMRNPFCPPSPGEIRYDCLDAHLALVSIGSSKSFLLIIILFEFNYLTFLEVYTCFILDLFRELSDSIQEYYKLPVGGK